MNRGGAILFEALLLIQLLVCVQFALHRKVIRRWVVQLQGLQELRTPYDGERGWKWSD